jgi:hypothetical protein
LCGHAGDTHAVRVTKPEPNRWLCRCLWKGAASTLLPDPPAHLKLPDLDPVWKPRRATERIATHFPAVPIPGGGRTAPAATMRTTGGHPSTSGTILCRPTIRGRDLRGKLCPQNRSPFFSPMESLTASNYGIDSMLKGAAE